MQLARVIGEVVSSVKDANLTGRTMLVLQPVSADGGPAGRTLVALDSVGAGVGEHVFFVRGREAAFPFYPSEPPTDAAVIGIVDHWDLEGEAASIPNSQRRGPDYGLRASSRPRRSASRGGGQDSGESAEAPRAAAERPTPKPR